MKIDSSTFSRLAGGLLCLAGAACSQAPTGVQTSPIDDPTPTAGSGGSPTSGAGTNSTVTGGQAGAAQATGGSGGVVSSGGTGSGGVATGGTAGVATGGTTAGGAGGSGGMVAMPMGPFSCTQFTGLLVTKEMWDGGFENGGVDGTKFQGKFVHYGYIDIWANPAGFTWPAALSSPCTQNSTNPDRVVFTAWSWEIRDEAAYVKTTSDCVNTFKTNYPGMKRMDLMTIVRCPDNSMCNPNAKLIVGTTDHDASLQDCYVDPVVDSALDKVAAAFPGLVYVAPKFFSPACRSPVDGGHLGPVNNQKAAADIAAYYKTMP